MEEEPLESSHEIVPETRRPDRLRRLVFLLSMSNLAIIFGFSAFIVADRGQHLELFWMHVLLELAVAFFSFAVISAIVSWLRTHNNDPLGVEDVFPQWLEGISRHGLGHRMRGQFLNARKVEMLGVSLYNSLIGYPQFESRLSKRLTNGSKQTRFLLLAEGGDEIKRRNLEPREKEDGDLDISQRNAQSHAAIRNGHSKRKRGYLYDILRTFDYSPPVNFIRFDKVAYIVFLTEHGGYSPAVEVRQGSLLFEHYQEMFEFMWGRSLHDQQSNEDMKSGTVIDQIGSGD